MPMSYALPVISKSGHVFEILIEFRPHKDENVVDPCGKGCWRKCMEEMQEIADKIKASLNPKSNQPEGK